MPAEMPSPDRVPSLRQILEDSPESTEPLDREEERRLLERYAETGDTEIRNLLVRANARWAIKRAAQYARDTHLSYEDASSAALQGLLRGVEKFDVQHPDAVRLISYADWWIRQRIQEARSDRASGPVRQTPLAQLKLRKLQQTRRRLKAQLGRPPRREEIRRALNLTDRQLQGIRRSETAQVQHRLDAQANDGERDLTLYEIFPGTGAEDIAEPLE